MTTRPTLEEQIEAAKREHGITDEDIAEDRRGIAALEGGKKPRAPRQYAPGWRLAGVPVDAKLRRSERGFKRDERVVGVWDVVKGQPGMWVVARQPQPDGRPDVFLVGAVALADTKKADRASVDPGLLARRSGKNAPTTEERAETARRNGVTGGRPRLEGGERREPYPIRLPVDDISGLAEMAAERDASDPHSKPARLAADIISQGVAKWRRARGKG